MRTRYKPSTCIPRAASKQDDLTTWAAGFVAQDPVNEAQAWHQLLVADLLAQVEGGR